MSDQPSSAASEQNTQSPGAMLRAARERKGLGIEQVATQLNLRPTLVNGMENDQYDQLRIPAYRRGYLRAYARLLEIDPAPVLKAHDATHSTGEEPMKAPPTPLKPIKRPGRLGKATFRLISIIIVVVLIALMVLWWKGHSGADFSNTDTGSDSSTQQISNDNGTDQPASSDQTTTTGQNQPVGNANAQGTANGNGNGNDDQQPDTTAGNASAANTGDTGNNQAQNDQQSDNGMRVQVGQGVDGSQMTASEAEAMHRNADNQQQPAPGNQPQAQAGQQGNQAQDNQAQAGTPAQNGQQDSQAQSANSIQLTFNQDSWTRITDANGKRVLNGLQRAGSQQTVNGQPPFHLTVGNSHGVAVTYKGQPVDLGSRTVAHINLGN